jgi:hypothetical protein
MKPRLVCLLIGAAAVGVAVEVASSVVDLQRFAQTETASLELETGARGGASLVNLHPGSNAWFLLTLQGAADAPAAVYHLENAHPATQVIHLDAAAGALTLSERAQTSTCAPWMQQPLSELERARRSALPFAPLCGGRLFLRNSVRGRRTTLEATTEFLRDHVWGGERIIGFVRREFFKDAFIERGQPVAGATAAANGTAPSGAPLPAALAPGREYDAITPASLGLDVDTVGGAMVPGKWTTVRGLDGIFVSLMQGSAVIGSAAASVAPAWRPDTVEARALFYLVAFDLSRYQLGFVLGTEHPRLGWSPRARDEVRDPALPGPDGFDTAAPLVRTGMMVPSAEAAVVAAFTGGFKREHSAFRYGALAQRNRGSHYGFVEQGVVFSRLIPGLATLYALDDGSVGMKTWTDEDDALLPRLRSARQNGVPLVEPDANSGVPMPGALVERWGMGNWSGSADEQLRTLRAGACLLENGPHRHLVYGYFSTARPSTMARVFLAYGCRYAMHLDMNALEHTYLALYPRRGERIVVQHLVRDMTQLDKASGDSLLPRFLAFPDDRDFFYVARRPGKQ